MGKEQELFSMKSLLPGSNQIRISNTGIEVEVQHAR